MALTEIQVPLTIQHVSIREQEGVLCVKKKKNLPGDLQFSNEFRPEVGKKDVREIIARISLGVYRDIESLLDKINSLHDIKNHLKFKLQPGMYVEIICTCPDECFGYVHKLSLSNKLRKILGFENYNIKFDGNEENMIIGNRYADFINALPTLLMVYSDICQPYVTGDVQTPLLRVVPLEFRNYTYRSIEIKNFTPPMYIPLLSTSFQLIEIDIRSQQGNPIPFDFSTLTVTLYFKRMS